MQKGNINNNSGQAGGQSSTKGPGRGWRGDSEGHRRAAQARRRNRGRLNQ